MKRIAKQHTQFTFDQVIDAEALWVYRYMKHTGQEVNADYPSAKVQAFKTLCLEEGDYTVKEDNKSTGTSKQRGLYNGK